MRGIWCCTRKTIDDTWSILVNMWLLVNSAYNELEIVVANTGEEYYFSSNRAGNTDIYRLIYVLID